jgi:hypothetical protein
MKSNGRNFSKAYQFLRSLYLAIAQWAGLEERGEREGKKSLNIAKTLENGRKVAWEEKNLLKCN